MSYAIGSLQRTRGVSPGRLCGRLRDRSFFAPDSVLARLCHQLPLMTTNGKYSGKLLRFIVAVLGRPI